MTVMWEEIAKITDKNPFQQIAQARGAQWRECAEKMERHENSSNQIRKNNLKIRFHSNRKYTLLSSILTNTD